MSWPTAPGCRYDALVLATGSIPTLPPIRGLVRVDGRLHERGARLPQPRRLPAARRARCRTRGSAVVVGGGLLGLQVARALAVRGLATEVVEGGEHLLRSQVDAKAGAILARDLRRLGTTVYTGARAVRLTDDGLRPRQRLRARRPTSSCSPPAAGRRPRWPAAPGSTSAAASSSTTACAPATRASTPSATAPSTAARSPGFVPPAWEQAGVLAAHLAGEDVGVRRQPHRRPAARHRPRRRRARRPRSAPRARSSR